MNRSREPRAAVVWNDQKHRYDWSVTRSDGKTITGSADTEEHARLAMTWDWRVRGEAPRFIGRRLPRGGIEPPAPP